MKTQLATGGLALALLASGCSTDALVEKATEKAIEQSIDGDADVDIDLDSGNITITDEDGQSLELTTDDDGENATLEITSDDGDQVVEIGKGLVDGWPSGYPIPDGVTILQSSKVDDASTGTTSFITMFANGSDFDAIAAHLSALAGGAEPTNSITSNAGEGNRALTEFYDLEGGGTLNLSVTETDDDGVAGSIMVLNQPS